MRGLLPYSNHDDFDVSYDQLLSYCDIDRPEFTPCEVGYELSDCARMIIVQLQVIFINSASTGGAAEIKQIAYGGLLLIAVITAAIF